MTTCPQCGADTVGTERCRECGHDAGSASAAATAEEPTEEPTAETEPIDEQPALPETEAKPSRWPARRPVLTAAVVGVVGLVVGGLGGYGVSQLQDDGDGSGASAKLALPGTLSGGYTRNKTIDTQIASSVSSARTTLGAGTDMALYTHGQTQVLIQATRLPGQAILNAGMTYAKTGDAVCASTSGSNGSEAICTRTSDNLTVQATATDSKTAAKYVDEVYNALA